MSIILVSILVLGIGAESGHGLTLENHYVSKCCGFWEVLDRSDYSCTRPKSGRQGSNPQFPPDNFVLHLDKYLDIADLTVTHGNYETKCRSGGGGKEVIEAQYLSSDGRYLAENSTIRGEVWKSYDCTDFIYNEDESLQLVVVTCDTVKSLGCLENTCIQKCCHFGYSLSEVGGCERRGEESGKLDEIDLFYKNMSQIEKIEEENVRIDTDFFDLFRNHYSSGRGWECPNVYQMYPEQYNLLYDGRLHDILYNETTALYCIDYFLGWNSTMELSVLRCVESIADEKQYLPDPVWEGKRTLRLIQIVCICISLIAIIATFIVYLILPDLRNLNGKIFIRKHIPNITLKCILLMYQ